jgi:hypothetical protein
MPDMEGVVGKSCRVGCAGVAFGLCLLFARVAGASPVYIMTLGDSITQGGTTGNGYAQVGYRYDLYYDLQAAGLNFQYVGTQTSVNNSTPDPAQYPDYYTTFEPQNEGW